MKTIDYKIVHHIARNYCGKVFVIEYDNEIYYLGEIGYLYANKNLKSVKFYLLFDEDKCIGKSIIKPTYASGAEICNAIENQGIKIAPQFFAKLTTIEIDKEYRGKHLGDLMMNWLTKDMQKLAKDLGEDVPILFNKANGAVADNFYKKWGAVVNSEEPSNKVGEFCPMIIKVPKENADITAKTRQLGVYGMSNNNTLKKQTMTK